MNKLFKILLATFSSFFISFSAFAGEHYTGPDLTGQKVVMFGPWLSPEQEIMREVGAIFEKATGATFEYGGSDSFEQQVMIDLKAGSAADLVVFPQPGLAANADKLINNDDKEANKILLNFFINSSKLKYILYFTKTFWLSIHYL